MIVNEINIASDFRYVVQAKIKIDLVGFVLVLYESTRGQSRGGINVEPAAEFARVKIFVTERYCVVFKTLEKINIKIFYNQKLSHILCDQKYLI